MAHGRSLVKKGIGREPGTAGERIEASTVDFRPFPSSAYIDVIDDETQRRTCVRKLSVPIEDLLEEVGMPGDARPLATPHMLAQWKSGKVPAPIAAEFTRQYPRITAAARCKQDGPLTSEQCVWAAREAAGQAIHSDACGHRDKQRDQCGARTLFVSQVCTVSGRTRVAYYPYRCMGHGCPRCAPLIALTHRRKVGGQIEADIAAARALAARRAQDTDEDPAEGTAPGTAQGAPEAIPEAQYLFLTMTWPRSDPDGPAMSWRKVTNAWRNLRRRFTRAFGAFAYFRTLEGHRGGWAHMHVLLRAPGLAMAMADEAGQGLTERFAALREKDGAPKAARKLYGALLARVAKMVQGVGFAQQFSCEPVVTPPAMGAELCKTSQVPWYLPRGVRRFEASRGRDAFFVEREVDGVLLGGGRDPVGREARRPASVGGTIVRRLVEGDRGWPEPTLDDVTLPDLARPDVHDPVHPAAGADLDVQPGTYRFRVLRRRGRSLTLGVLAPAALGGQQVDVRWRDDPSAVPGAEFAARLDRTSRARWRITPVVWPWAQEPPGPDGAQRFTVDAALDYAQTFSTGARPRPQAPLGVPGAEPVAAEWVTVCVALVDGSPEEVVAEAARHPSGVRLGDATFDAVVGEEGHVTRRLAHAQQLQRDELRTEAEALELWIAWLRSLELMPPAGLDPTIVRERRMALQHLLDTLDQARSA